MTEFVSVALSAKGLCNIVPSSQTETFAFIVNGRRHECCRSLAQYLSPRVSRLHTFDPSINGLELDDFGFSNCIPALSALMDGEPIRVSPADACSLLLVAESLGNTELCGVIRGLAPSTVTLANAIPLFLRKERLGLDYGAEVRFIASHFASFSVQTLSSVPAPLLQAVLDSSDLRVEMESELFRTVQTLVASAGKDYQVLYENLLFEYLDEKDVVEFLAAVQFEDVGSSLWVALGRRLVQKVSRIDLSGVERFTKGTVPFVGDPFDGVASYLRKQAGGNPVTGGLIGVSYSTGNSYCEKLFERDWKCYWSSENAADQWLLFDFPKHQLYVTEYTLKSPNSKAGWNHLKSWLLEGSDDGETWEEIDRREGNNDLNGRSRVKTFACQQPAKVRKLRLHQIGKNHRNADDIQLSGIEFFGRLFEAELSIDK
jgi:hypothetical protein